MRQESPKQFVITLAEKIRNSARANTRQLVQGSVVLRKRLRDLNDDDRTGVYSPVTGNWTTIDQSGIYSWNIVKPTVRANTTSLSSAKVKITSTPRFTKDANGQMAADVANALIEQHERDQWNQALEEYIANEQQLGAGVFIRVAHNPNKTRKHSLPKWEDVEVLSGGMAACGQCGNEYSFEDEAICCGVPSTVLEEPRSDTVPVPTEYEEFSTGCSETNAYPFWEFRIDPIGTQGANLKAAKWFERHYGVPLDELELEYPESVDAIRGASGVTSYALKWQYALQSGRSIPADDGADMPVEIREVRDIWVTPSMYLNVELTEDLVLKDAEGKVRFKVKQGQTYADGVFEGQKFEEPPVLCFRVIGEALVDIFPSDFREEFFYITFLSNPSTFWGLFATELITLQDIVNYMLTIQMYHIRRNAITSIVYDRGSFDPEAFNEDLIPTKQALMPDADIKQKFGVVPSLGLNGEVMEMLITTMQTKGDITQVQPAMVGETQPGQPYAAQLLQKQQSMGLLASASLSKANAKVGWAKRNLKLDQDYWTDEDTEELLRLNGEWTPDTIDAFLECDIETDLIIDFAQGSETPTTLMEREMKFRQTLMDISQLATIDPTLVKPETVNEILMEILQAGGIDIDINNTESDLRLAESRYDKLLEIVRSSPVQTQEPMANEMFAKRIVSQPIFRAYPFEGHATIIEFYQDRATQEASKDNPDFLLISCIQGLLSNQMQAQIQQGQIMMASQVAIQQPMMQQQMAMQEQAGQQEMQNKQLESGQQAEADQVARDGEKETRQMDREDAESERNFQREMKLMDMANAEAEREVKAKEKAKEKKAA